jgi:hypothetical protein
VKGDVVDAMQILTVEQVAEREQLSAKTVRAIRAADLEASRLTQGRGGWRLRDDAIADWLGVRSNRAKPRPMPDVASGATGRAATTRAGIDTGSHRWEIGRLSPRS